MPKYVLVYIVRGDNFRRDFLIGLDTITQFKLCQRNDLTIFQNFSANTDNVNNFWKNNNNLNVNFNEFVETRYFQSNSDYLGDNKKYIISHLVDKYTAVFAKDRFDIGAIEDREARILSLPNVATSLVNHMGVILWIKRRSNLRSLSH